MYRAGGSVVVCWVRWISLMYAGTDVISLLLAVCRVAISLVDGDCVLLLRRARRRLVAVSSSVMMSDVILRSMSIVCVSPYVSCWVDVSCCVCVPVWVLSSVVLWVCWVG